MKLVVTGSIAFDYLMSFPGKFTEHLLPEHMHRVSLSFLVDTMDKRRGGCAPNIAYTLALLGERPLLMATAGQDFGDYRIVARGGRHRHVAREGRRRQVHRVVLLQHRPGEQPDRVVLHRRDGQRRRVVVPPVPGLKDDGLVIISPNDPDGMVQYAQECSTLGIRYIWDPGQQCARMDGAAARRRRHRRLHGDRQRLRVRAAAPEDRDERGRRPASEVEVLVITRGENGCTVLSRGTRVDVPAVAPDRIEDPTGVGDAFRGGFMKGLAIGASYEVCARLGSVAATYALEHLGGTSHAYTLGRICGALREALRPLT